MIENLENWLFKKSWTKATVLDQSTANEAVCYGNILFAHEYSHWSEQSEQVLYGLTAHLIRNKAT